MRTATHCNTLQHTAGHCNTLQHTATHCNTPTDSSNKKRRRALQHTATHCNTLQHTATHCNTLQDDATHCNTLQYIATHLLIAGRSADVLLLAFRAYACACPSCVFGAGSVRLSCSLSTERIAACMLQCVAVCCSVLQVCATELKFEYRKNCCLYVVMCCSALQCVAVCCSVL